MAALEIRQTWPDWSGVRRGRGWEKFGSARVRERREPAAQAMFVTFACLLYILTPKILRTITLTTNNTYICTIYGNLEQYPLSVISGLAERTVVSTRAKVDPRSGPF